MKKVISIISIIAFLSTLVIPFVYTNRSEDAVSYIDNKILAEKPIVAVRNGDASTYADAVNDYYDDRIGCRSELLDLNGRIKCEVFNQSPYEAVIVGKDGWLFYNGNKDTEVNDGGCTISQYLGVHRFTEEELQTIADKLIRTRDYLAERNCEFVLYIAPNKERVYSEYMPDKYQNARTSDNCSTDQIIEYLRENTDIRVVWPYEDLMEYKNSHPEEPMYFKLDTHWNEWGGYIGAKALLDELGVNTPPLEDIKKTKYEITNSGDLRGRMPVGDWLTMDDSGWDIEGILDSDTIVDEGNFLDHYRYYNKNKDPRTLLVRRDSFTTNMRYELGSAFNNVDLCHNGAYTPALLDEENPDIFVLETIEKFVPYELENLSIIPE